MRAKVHHHALVAAAEDPGVGKCRNTRANLNGDTTCVVEDAVLEAPAVGVPYPVCQRAVDEGSPEKDKDHAGDDAAALGNGANGESSSDGAKHHLVKRIQQGRD